MIDRAFAAALFLLALGYGAVALKLHAPFQYDPLGPESWPRLLAVGLLVAALALYRRPDANPDWHGAKTLRSLAAMGGGLVFYAVAFESLGFILSTSVFCALSSRMLGARMVRGAVFGVAIGVVGYFVCTRLLALNLPAGLLPF